MVCNHIRVIESRTRWARYIERITRKRIMYQIIINADVGKMQSMPKGLLKATGFILRKYHLDWIDVANNIVYGRAVVDCRNGIAGFCCLKVKELNVQTVVLLYRCIARRSHNSYRKPQNMTQQ